MDYFSSLANGLIRNIIYKLVGPIDELPFYGFKIHISSEPLKAQKLLNIIERYCLDNKITYKYIFKKKTIMHLLKRISIGFLLVNSLLFIPLQNIFSKKHYMI